MAFHVEHSSILNEVSREKIRQLCALLLRWNRTINLISRDDEPLIWERHVADSIQLVTLMTPPPGRAIDLGSGAGFPGLILALASGVPFELIEADRRKAAFLRQAVRLTDAPATVHPVRIQAARLAPAPLITARALAPLPRLLDLAAPFLAPGGQCLFLKGAGVEAELTDAARQWHMRVQQIPSRTAPNASILRISNLSRVIVPD